MASFQNNPILLIIMICILILISATIKVTVIFSNFSRACTLQEKSKETIFPPTKAEFTQGTDRNLHVKLNRSSQPVSSRYPIIFYKTDDS